MAETSNAASYLKRLDAILGADADLAGTVGPGATQPAPATGTTRENLKAEAERYQSQFERLDGITPPRSLEAEHARLTKALAAQALMSSYAADRTPAEIPASSDNITAWGHAVPGVGYARDDQSAAQCEMKGIADELGVTYRILGACGAAANERPAGKTAGSATAPVSNVFILHEAIPASGGAPMGRPNVDGFEYSTIYAKAGQPLTIVFDNRNPAPFVFNIAVYRGEDARVRAADLVAQTGAYAGPRVHTLHFNQPSVSGSNNLVPGTYTYVDNAHPAAMRGKLIVVQ